MARNNRKPSGVKRNPAPVDLSPPKQATAPRRKLASLPEVQTGNAARRNKDSHRAEQRIAGPRRTPPRQQSNLPKSGGAGRHTASPRLGKGAYARQPRRRPGFKLSPSVKRVFGYIAGIAVVGVLVVMVGLHVFGGNAIAVYLGDVQMGYMQLSRETTSESFHMDVIAHIEARAVTQVIVTENVTIRPARFVASRNISGRQDMINRIGMLMSYQIVARAIYVNGNFEVLVRGDNCIAEIERLIKEPWINDNTIDSSFAAEWHIESRIVDHNYEGIRTPLQAISSLDRIVEADYLYTIQGGDNLGIISMRFNTTPDRIALRNGISTHDVIHPGNSLIVPVRRPLLAVVTVDQISETVEIPMPIYTRQNDEMPISTTMVVQEGSSGQKQISRQITFINGVQSNEVELEAVIIREPVEHIIDEGTRPLPTAIERR